MTLSQNLGKLSLGILENFVKGSLGNDFIRELRVPDEKIKRVASALKSTERRFLREYPDKEISIAFLELPLHDLPGITRAAQEFYVHPTSDVFSSQLREHIADSFQNLSLGTTDRIVRTYVAILTEELAVVDEDFRNNIRALIELRAQQSQDYIQTQSALLEKLETFTIPKESTFSQSELTDTLRNVQNLLSQLQVPSQQSRKRFTSKSLVFSEMLNLEVDPELCFVLMPFGPSWSRKLYEHHIVPSCENNTLRPLRADDIYGVTGIMQDVWNCINKARIIIADLTTRNPNVFYEVGISHALGKDVILLTQNMDDVPFDLRAIRCIVYSLELDGPKQLELQLTKTIKAIL